MKTPQKVKVEVVDDDDCSSYYDPEFDAAALAVNLNDIQPGPGLCLPRFHANVKHHDIRDDPTFTTYYVVLADERHGGGVYINKDDMGWMLQGVSPKPEVLKRTSWLACMKSWQNMCRLGLHPHPPPKNNDPWLAISTTLSTPQPLVRTTSPSHPSPRKAAEPPKPASPSPKKTNTASRAGTTTTPAIISTKSKGTVPASGQVHPAAAKPRLRVATPACPSVKHPSRGTTPVTPTSSRTHLGFSPRPFTTRTDRSPSPADSRTPTRLLFASRGSTPHSGIVTSSPVRAEQMLDEHGEVFISRGRSALVDAVKYSFVELHNAQHAVATVVSGTPCQARSNQIVLIDMPSKRKKADDDPSKHTRGRTPWALGTKREFLLRFFSRWTCLSKRKRGAFYDHVLCAFIAKYGMHFDLSTDLAEDRPDPDPTGNEIDHTTYSAEESALRTAYTDMLRTKISQWFRDEEQRVSKSSAAEVDYNKIWDSHIVTVTQKKPPVNLRITHYYSSHHYDTRIKSTFEREWALEKEKWAAKCKAWTEAGKDIPDDETPPVQVSVRTRVTKECWEREPQSFKALVTLAHDQERETKAAEREMEAAAAPGPLVLRRPEDYQRAIDTAAIYVQPTADALAAKLGLVCAILLCGPLPSEGGAIGMLSIHSGEMPGSIQWFDHDRPGYALVERSMVGFGEHVFSASERARRSLTAPQPTTLSTTRRSRSPSGHSPSVRRHSASLASSPSARHRSASLASSPSVRLARRRNTSLASSPSARHRNTSLASSPSARHRSASLANSPSVRLARRRNTSLASTPTASTSCMPGTQPSGDRDDTVQGSTHAVWSTAVTDEWPQHIRDAFAAFNRGRQWGTNFADAVYVYRQLEGHFGFPLIDDGRRLLAGSLRPSIYASWEKLGRPYDMTMNVRDVGQYFRKYWLWWEAVQPASRFVNDQLLPVENFEDLIGSIDDWDGLDRCCGKDGLIQALMMLLWWGDAVNMGNGRHAKPAQWMEWDTAVQEFHDILTLMMRTPGFAKVARKRKRDLHPLRSDSRDSKRARKGSNTRDSPRKRSRKDSQGKALQETAALAGETSKKRKAPVGGSGGSRAKRSRTISTPDELALALASADGPAISVPRALRDRATIRKTAKVRGDH
ncbi:hypothetical protein HDZ31DRAFT_42573 [Schizophyllum fasciatum]